MSDCFLSVLKKNMNLYNSCGLFVGLFYPKKDKTKSNKGTLMFSMERNEYTHSFLTLLNRKMALRIK